MNLAENERHGRGRGETIPISMQSAAPEGHDALVHPTHDVIDQSIRTSGFKAGALPGCRRPVPKTSLNDVGKGEEDCDLLHLGETWGYRDHGLENLLIAELSLGHSTSI